MPVTPSPFFETPQEHGLTPEKAAELENMLLDYQRANSHKTTDLSKPVANPKLSARVKFPAVVYRHSTLKQGHDHIITNQLGQQQVTYKDWHCEQKLVNNADELEDAIKQGWSDKRPSDIYTKPAVQSTADVIEASKPALPNFDELNKERLIAYAKATFDIDISATEKRDGIIEIIKQAHSEMV